MKLIMENVRCFAGQHEIPIKPLTMLIGENNSGKSTCLAALSVVLDPFGFPWQPRLNEPPYNLGNYDTIATFKGGRYGRASSFCFGIVHDAPRAREPDEIRATYRGKNGQVAISRLTVRSSYGKLEIVIDEEDNQRRVQITAESRNRSESYTVPIKRSRREATPLGNEIVYEIFEYLAKQHETKPLYSTLYRLLMPLVFEPELFGRGTMSIAPIRTKPKRTYDEVTEEFSPEGEHIPFVLLQRLKDKNFVTALERFGENSGLFKHITVKQWGSRAGSALQVLVTSSGRPANLVDVGYGVSQALPVVVQSVLASKERLLLLQQPEVHLHPRAQAALGSFFVDMVVEGGKQFVVETHSDYIVDRVRQEVVNGRIRQQDVEILYFEKNGIDTAVHILTLDECGNIVGSPPTYREFFLKEALNLLNPADR